MPLPVDLSQPVTLYRYHGGSLWAWQHKFDEPENLERCSWIICPRRASAACAADGASAACGADASGKRAFPFHEVYGNGDYGQQAVTKPRCHRLQKCNHAFFDWSGTPFPTEHSHGLKLHTDNIIEMNEAKLTGMDAVCRMSARLGSEPWEQMKAKILSSCDAFIWYQMQTHKSKYRAWMAKCKDCGHLAWVSKTPHSTAGFVDHEVATLATFFEVHVPEHLKHDLESHVPMV